MDKENINKTICNVHPDRYVTLIDGHEYPIYIYNSDNYKNKTTTLCLTLGDVRQVLERKIKTDNPNMTNVFIGVHTLIIGNSYLFSPPSKDSSVIMVSGYYVDGNTGEVNYRHTGPVIVLQDIITEKNENGGDDDNKGSNNICRKSHDKKKGVLRKVLKRLFFGFHR